MQKDNEISKEEREFEIEAKKIIEKAKKEHRIPIECLEEMEVNPLYSVQVIVYKEC